MANTFELISAVTVGASPQSSIDFTSIPATFNDLCLKISCREDSTSQFGFNIKLNTSTASFTSRWLEGAGSGTPVSYPNTNNQVAYGEGNNLTASTFASADIYIPNYAGSTKKSISSDSVQENNAATAYSALTAILWSNTSAITSLSLTSNAAGTGFAQHSTFYLYGVSNA
jgi:hypothetical protein